MDWYQLFTMSFFDFLGAKFRLYEYGKILPEFAHFLECAGMLLKYMV